jgi:hypothetical protein
VFVNSSPRIKQSSLLREYIAYKKSPIIGSNKLKRNSGPKPISTAGL